MAVNEPRIVLRALEPTDIDILYQWENDNKIWQVSQTLVPYSRYILKQYIENSHKDIYEMKQQRFMIDVESKSDTHRSIGTIDLFDFDPNNQRAGVGILIAAENDRGRGFASKALSELIRYAFDTLHLKQLYCNILLDNEASMQLFQKAGFDLVGIKKNWIRTKEGFKDEALFQLINNQY